MNSRNSEVSTLTIGDKSRSPAFVCRILRCENQPTGPRMLRYGLNLSLTPPLGGLSRISAPFLLCSACFMSSAADRFSQKDAVPLPFIFSDSYDPRNIMRGHNAIRDICLQVQQASFGGSCNTVYSSTPACNACSHCLRKSRN